MTHPVPAPPASASPAAAEGSDDLALLLAPLEGLGERPVDEHPAAYEQVHAGLRGVLSGDAPTGEGPAARA